MMIPDVVWIPLDLTYIRYREGDGLIGVAMAWLSLLPILLYAMCFAALLARRELQLAVYVLGQTLNELFSYSLKSLINIPRPIYSPRPGLGMPSSHSQFMWFFAAYTALHVLSKHVRWAQPKLWKSAWIAAVISAACGVGASRLYLWVHSIDQVVAGAALGVLCGSLWFAFARAFVLPRGIDIEQHWLARFCMLRDSSAIENVVAREYANSRRSRAAQFAEHAARRHLASKRALDEHMSDVRAIIAKCAEQERRCRIAADQAIEQSLRDNSSQ
jgi:dolichyldiphosphatase